MRGQHNAYRTFFRSWVYVKPHVKPGHLLKIVRNSVIYTPHIIPYESVHLLTFENYFWANLCSLHGGLICISLSVCLSVVWTGPKFVENNSYKTISHWQVCSLQCQVASLKAKCLLMLIGQFIRKVYDLDFRPHVWQWKCCWAIGRCELLEKCLYMYTYEPQIGKLHIEGFHTRTRLGFNWLKKTEPSPSQAQV